MIPKIVVAVAVTLATISVLEACTRYWWAPQWKTRGYPSNIASTKAVLIRSSIAAAAAAAGVIVPEAFGWPHSNVLAAVTYGAAGWLAALAWSTDMAVRKIPSEACYAVFLIGTIGGLTSYSAAAAASAIVAFTVFAVLLLSVALLTRGSLGSGDIRMLLAFTPLAWFTGYTPFLIGLMLACVTQLALWFTVYRAYPQKGRPFAPALILGLATAIALFSDSSTYCNEWAGLLSCVPEW